ncbi:Sec-independent protein translocase protein TatB [Rubellimicrobium arenae]|uniref:Sec-independent protein translocase protein TatB n=1 Tax=Rubellimicrobium arenae TaxID=2817372 RepID=UPI001B315E2B|nr:Sec-independent protein translocase protein TatB [Rubellimicrobium arenae]
MFDLGWSEMMLVGVVALIVVGPKELPNLFRSVGQAVGKARGMAREFTRAMEAAADEAGVKEINRTINAATRPVQFGANSLRQAALGQTSTAAKPAAPATPLNPGAPVKPGGATEALAAQRAEERTRIQEEAQQRAEIREAAPTTPDHVPSDGTT